MIDPVLEKRIREREDGSFAKMVDESKEEANVSDRDYLEILEFKTIVEMFGISNSGPSREDPENQTRIDSGPSREDQENETRIEKRIKKGKKKTGKRRVAAPTVKQNPNPKPKQDPAVMSPQLQDLIINNMRGTDIKLVIQKAITKSDANRNQGRLTMPTSQADTTCFTEDEIYKIDHEQKIDVTLIEPSLKVCQLKLRIWNKNLVLIHGWSKVFENEANMIQPDAQVQVWSYRGPESELCFALVVLQ